MTPVATYCRWKPILSACWKIPIGLAALAIALVLVPFFIMREHASWALLIVAIMPLAIGGFSFTEGVRRAQAAFEKDCWLKAGPEGIAFRLPGRARRNALFLTYDIMERTILWSDVVRYYPRVEKVNGITTSRNLVFETRQGNFYLEGVWFSQSPTSIADAIQRAAAE